MFLLDTNVISELRRPRKANPKVAAWADGVRQAELFLLAITILEIEMGILKLERRDQAQGAACARGWIAIFDRRLMVGFCRSIPRSHYAARDCMCQTADPTVTP
jgi:toxin FitB